MSYQSNHSSYLDYGIVKIGRNINVVDGVISCPQDVSAEADVTFNNVKVLSDLTVGGHPVVYSIEAGDGITLSDNHGNIIISAVSVKSDITKPDNQAIKLCSKCSNNTILVDDDYNIKYDDYYIGVNSKIPVTITLPNNVENGITKVIKLEMDAPLGNRKVTVTTSDGSLIDDSHSVILQSPFETIVLLYRGGFWNIISHF